MEDLTPTYTQPSAETELLIPPSVTASATAQPIGGFMASPSSFTSGNVTLNGAKEQILVGSATAPNVGAGIFIGNVGDGTYDFRAGDPSSNYIWYDASAGTLTVVGSITVTAGGTIGGFNVGADYIRDVANSFGLASTVTVGDDVRFWAGDTFANRATAPFHVTESGIITAKNAIIGGNTYQYTQNDYGMYTYGDFSDGLVTLDGSTSYSSFSSHSGANYTLTRDVYCSDLTINNNIFLFTGGFRIYCSGTLHLIGGATILNNGSDGTIGSNYTAGPNTGPGGAGGAGAVGGYFLAQVNGVTGGAGHQGSAGSGASSGGAAGGGGNSSSHSLYIGNASDGGAGGASPSAGLGGSSGGAAGPHGATTFRSVSPNSLFHITTMLDITAGVLSLYNAQAGGGGGGGGGGGTGNNAGESPGGGGGGGGSGGNGGVVWIAARNMVLDASGNIQANGGKGGNGGNATSAAATGFRATGGGGGGGGAGGSGGIIFLVYNTITNNGTVAAAGGTGGTGGAGGAGFDAGGHPAGTTGADGGVGSDGGPGITITKQLSM